MKKNDRKSFSLPNRTTINKNGVKLHENRKYIILYTAIVFCIPLLLYLKTLTFGLTHFDDNGIISNNITFLSDFENAPKAFTTDAYAGITSLFYRPLQTISYMVDIKVSGGDHPWMYHFSNILLFALTASMLFLFLHSFLIPPKLVLFSTLAFSVHPLFTSNVAWIPARGDLLLSFFALLSFLLLIGYIRKDKFVYLFLHWVAFTIALFCKETAAFLPFLFILYYFTFSADKPFEKKHLLAVILYGASGLLWLWLRSNSIGPEQNTESVYETGLSVLLTNLRSIPESLSSFIFPFEIAVIPAFSFFKSVVGCVFSGVMAFLFFYHKGRPGKEKLFALLWFLLLFCFYP